LCPSCYRALTIEIFPALFRERATIDAGTLALAEGEACCYEHAAKRAVSLCNQCGRFLCALCEVDVGGAIWCPSCLQLDKPAPGLNALETRRTLYDSISLALATWPAFLFFYPSIFTAPVVVYLAIRYWKAPSSLIPRNKWRFIVALLIAFLQLALLALIVIGIIVTSQRTRP
jgi:hypothetical protein